METPEDYRHEKNTETEKDVPTWDISPSDLDGFFDLARFERYLSWDNNLSFKRRITWLFPDNGEYTSIQIITISKHNL